MLKTIIVFAMLVKLSVPSLVGSCNKCFASNKVSCVNETHFSTCFQDSPTAIITKCPDNRFCTDDLLICRTTAEGYTPVCYHKDYCGTCQRSNGTFTCFDEKTYGFCYGGDTPLESSFRSCPHGYVCNLNFREVCVPEATNVPSCRSKITNITEITTTPTESTREAYTTTGSAVTDEVIITTENLIETKSEIAPTTQKTTSTTKKTELRDPNTICDELKIIGYIESDDPTCRQYIYCFVLSDQYLGWAYYCDGYYNAATKKCQKERPLHCVEY